MVMQGKAGGRGRKPFQAFLSCPRRGLGRLANGGSGNFLTGQKICGKKMVWGKEFLKGPGFKG